MHKDRVRVIALGQGRGLDELATIRSIPSFPFPRPPRAAVIASYYSSHIALSLPPERNCFMSSVACNNQFNLVLDVQDKKPQLFLSDSDQMRRLLVSLVQSAIRCSSDQIVQISVRVQEDESGMKRMTLKRPDDCLPTEADSCCVNLEQCRDAFCSNIPSVKPISIDLNRFEFPKYIKFSI